MKRSKRLLCFVISFLLIFVFVIPSFAVEGVPVVERPQDIGTLKYTISNNGTFVNYGYYYIKVTINDPSSVFTLTRQNDVLLTFGTSSGGRISVSYSGNGTYPVACFCPRNFYVNFSDNNIIYIFITIASFNSSGYTFYNSSNVNIIEFYSVKDYYDGLTIGNSIYSDLSLTGKITHFISQFTGNETANYITPLAICMILILIYCLFIRWILNLARSSKLTRLTDIVVLVSCIAILLIYYIPMIDFTINQNQVVETVYTIASDVNVGG